jgi:hypothetical protein
MAFEAASGWNNLPNGNWSPVIYSKKVLKFFRTLSVVEEITNTDYEGEIKNEGDTVKIIKEPVVTVTAYKRGQKVEPQFLSDEELTLVVDQAFKFSFPCEDIEKAHSHINWAALAQNSGAYALKNNYDQNILQYMFDNATTNAGVGVDGTEVSVGYGTVNDFSPMNYVARFKRLLDENDVPEVGRFFVAPPSFYEMLVSEDGKLVDIQTTGDPESALRNTKIGYRNLHGFIMLQSNNLPTDTSGDPVVLAGHVSATATATTILFSESFRSPDYFGDIFRGLHVFGRKVLRPEALFSGVATFGDLDA